MTQCTIRSVSQNLSGARYSVSQHHPLCRVAIYFVKCVGSELFHVLPLPVGERNICSCSNFRVLVMMRVVIVWMVIIWMVVVFVQMVIMRVMVVLELRCEYFWNLVALKHQAAL